MPISASNRRFRSKMTGAMLGPLYSSSICLTVAAAWNAGQHSNDPVLDKCRVRVRTNRLNGLAVGASDHASGIWSPVPYCSQRPGRSPGIAMPDLVVHGRSTSEPFGVSDPSRPRRSMRPWARASWPRSTAICLARRGPDARIDRSGSGGPANRPSKTYRKADISALLQQSWDSIRDR